MRSSKGHLHRVYITRKSATITCLVEDQRQARNWGTLQWKTKALGMIRLEIIGRGKLKFGYLEVGLNVLMGVVSPEMESGER
jgi:hypothetical protein